MFEFGIRKSLQSPLGAEKARNSQKMKRLPNAKLVRAISCRKNLHGIWAPLIDFISYIIDDKVVKLIGTVCATSWKVGASRILLWSEDRD